jgi:hypothetical protein
MVADARTATLPKSSVAGETVIDGVIPVPVNATETGCPFATPKVAVERTAPAALGVNVMDACADAPAAIWIGCVES